MPPKKTAAPEKKTLLGRPSNNLKIGIVGLFFTFNLFRKPTPSLGLPNVGKSSFFNALSETGVCVVAICFPDSKLTLVIQRSWQSC